MKKNYKIKVNFKKCVLYSLPLCFLFVYNVCMYQPTGGIIQPSTIKAGEVMNIKIAGGHATLRYDKPYRLVIGFLVPKGWSADQAGNTTMTYTSPQVGSGSLTLVPAGTKPDGSQLDYPTALKGLLKSVDPNLIDDNEWVVFWSDSKNYNANQDVTFDVNIKTKVGPENMLVKLGYYIGGYPDGSWNNAAENYVSLFSSCLSVTDGTGDGIDFCNKPLASMLPLAGVDNDIYKIDFDNDLYTTAISNASDIYICGTGTTTTGEIVTHCTPDEISKMRPLDQKKFSKMIWPRQFFNLKDGQVLAKMEYYFTDAAGNKVGFGGLSNVPFKHPFKCL